MTPDALNMAIGLQSKILEAQALKNTHLNAVKNVFKELAATDQDTISTALQAIHGPIIAGLQNQLTALDGNYVKPNPTPPTATQSSQSKGAGND